MKKLFLLSLLFCSNAYALEFSFQNLYFGELGEDQSIGYMAGFEVDNEIQRDLKINVDGKTIIDGIARQGKNVQMVRIPFKLNKDLFTVCFIYDNQSKCRMYKIVMYERFPLLQMDQNYPLMGYAWFKEIKIPGRKL